MKAVSNAGPLIALAKLGQLGLLMKLFDEIVIPHEVYTEVVTNGLLMGAADAGAIDFLVRQGDIRVTDVNLPSPMPDWAQAIDIGEVAVIVLSLDERADWVLIDNAHARKAARAMGLPLKGTIGLLVEGLRKGHLSLPEFELLIHTIRISPTLWISESLCEKSLIYARAKHSSRE